MSEQESNQRSRPGRGITGKCRNSRALATGKRPILIRCAEHHPARTPLPPREPPSTENVPIFSGLYGANFQICRMQAFKNRNIFECWTAMRRGDSQEGRICPKRPLESASFGTFLAETRKVRRVYRILSHSSGLEKRKNSRASWNTGPGICIRLWLFLLRPKKGPWDRRSGPSPSQQTSPRPWLFAVRRRR